VGVATSEIPAMMRPYIPNTPAMTIGTINFITNSRLITPIDATPTSLFIVPYVAPILEPKKNMQPEIKTPRSITETQLLGKNHKIYPKKKKNTNSVTLEPPNRRRRKTGAE
jgi:hypothetical protein